MGFQFYFQKITKLKINSKFFLKKSRKKNKIPSIFVILPKNKKIFLNILYKNANVESVEYGAESITVIALVDSKARGLMKKYAVDDIDDKESEDDWD